MMNSTPSPNSVAGTTYTWRIKDLMKFNNDLDMYFKVDTNAQSTDSIVVNVEIRPFGKDKDTANNKLKFVYKVSNSYDPNIKETYPETVLPNYNDWFYYTIHFQNTGNAPAYNIRLEDSIDAQLDYETMEVLDYSHQNRIAFNKNILKFYFDEKLQPLKNHIIAEVETEDVEMIALELQALFRPADSGLEGWIVPVKNDEIHLVDPDGNLLIIRGLR